MKPKGHKIVFTIHRHERYFILSIVCWIVAAILILYLLVGCASTKYIYPTCVPRSISQAVTVSVEKRVPTRIVISHTAVDFVDHAQAQALVNGRWCWLHYFQEFTEISDIADQNEFVVYKYRPLVPYKYLTVPEVIDELKSRGMLK